MSAVCCPNCGNAVYPLQYLTEEERRAARRKTWRESKRRHRILEAFLPAPAPVFAVPDVPELSSAHRYWLDRFSMEEIGEIGAGLTMFEVSSTAPNAAGRTPEPRGQRRAAA